ncbi:hypothetical protein [Oryza sativa Japonica Group]|uniref:Uncharacterized protein n=1 Tax=Oryza sativa subsp. japonica TaxID=39947 RepID=Q5ZAJ2_ORYSJ|nr:hypothetical protein [Oryza sativa Japonica Group]BAD53391.1 hypothetical protein [Oryza sativa Japonica Group]
MKRTYSWSAVSSNYHHPNTRCRARQTALAGYCSWPGWLAPLAAAGRRPPAPAVPQPRTDNKRFHGFTLDTRQWGGKATWMEAQKLVLRGAIVFHPYSNWNKFTLGPSSCRPVRFSFLGRKIGRRSGWAAVGAGDNGAKWWQSRGVKRGGQSG